nr:SDR family NAD(P)-dependent oxidoreductase [Mycobacterium sp. JS623]
MNSLADEIRTATGQRVETRALDVTDPVAVTEVVHSFAEAFGSLDRIIVNAGIGAGSLLGTGGSHANYAMAMTNFVAVLSQCHGIPVSSTAVSTSGPRSKRSPATSAEAQHRQSCWKPVGYNVTKGILAGPRRELVRIGATACETFGCAHCLVTGL